MSNTNKTTEDKPRTDTLNEPILEKKIWISSRDPKYSHNRMALIGYTVREEDVNKMDNIKNPVEKIDDKDKKIQELENKLNGYRKMLSNSKKAYWNNPPAKGVEEVCLCHPSGENWPDCSRLLVINVSNTDLDF